MAYIVKFKEMDLYLGYQNNNFVSCYGRDNAYIFSLPAAESIIKEFNIENTEIINVTYTGNNVWMNHKLTSEQITQTWSNNIIHPKQVNNESNTNRCCGGAR